MDFNILWMVLFLLADIGGNSQTTSVINTTVIATSFSTHIHNYTDAESTPVSAHTTFTSSNRTENSNGDTKSEFLEFIKELRLYFLIGGGCFLMIIILLCTILVCNCKRRDPRDKFSRIAKEKEVPREQTSYLSVNYTTDAHTYCGIQGSENRELV